MFTIMIIDDNVQLQNEIGNLLIVNGYGVLKPKDFNNIPKIVKEDNPDLILLDINLPNDDGFKICTEIRSFSKIPIIFITSRNTNIDELMAIPAEDIFTKDILEAVNEDSLANLRQGRDGDSYLIGSNYKNIYFRKNADGDFKIVKINN